MYSHIKRFRKEQIQVIRYDIKQLLKMDELDYFRLLKEEYDETSKDSPVIIIHPMLERDKWLRFQPQNIFLTNDHEGRDYKEELIEILNAPTRLEVLTLFIKRLVKDQIIDWDLMKRKYFRLSDIPSLDLAIG